MTLRTVLLSLQALMASPEPDDPQDAVVAKQYKDSIETFKTTARYWTSKYAKGMTGSFDSWVAKLKDDAEGETSCRYMDDFSELGKIIRIT